MISQGKTQSAPLAIISFAMSQNMDPERFSEVVLPVLRYANKDLRKATLDELKRLIISGEDKPTSGTVEVDKGLLAQYRNDPEIQRLLVPKKTLDFTEGRYRARVEKELAVRAEATAPVLTSPEPPRASEVEQTEVEAAAEIDDIRRRITASLATIDTGDFSRNRGVKLVTLGEQLSRIGTLDRDMIQQLRSEVVSALREGGIDARVTFGKAYGSAFQEAVDADDEGRVRDIIASAQLYAVEQQNIDDIDNVPGVKPWIRRMSAALGGAT